MSPTCLSQLLAALGDAAASIRFDSNDLAAQLSATDVTPEALTRFDYAVMQSPKRTREGFLSVDGVITKAGVFPQPYKGKMVREFRPPSEVLKQDSLDSFALRPLTLGHPDTLLTPETAKQYMIGTVGTPVARGDTAVAPILITDANAIAAIEERGLHGLSCGYASMIWAVPGEWTKPDGTVERFDTIQTNITGNHVAIVKLSNVGPEAAIKMDEATVSVATSKGPTMKIRIGQTEFEVEDAIGAAIMQERNDAAKTADRLAGQLAAQQTTAQAAAVASQDEQRLASRLELIARCAPVLGKAPTELVRMDEASLMRAVLAVKAPDIKLDNRSAEFVAGAFEQCLLARVDSVAQMRIAVGAAQSIAAAPADEIAAARKRMEDAYKNDWKANSSTGAAGGAR